MKFHDWDIKTSYKSKIGHAYCLTCGQNLPFSLQGNKELKFRSMDDKINYIKEGLNRKDILGNLWIKNCNEYLMEEALM